MSTDLTLIRGDTAAFTMTLVDPAGDPYDLTGASLWFTVGDDFSKTDADGIAVDPDPTTGIAVVTIEPADTVEWPCIRTVKPYAVRLETATADIYTPLRGRFIVLPVPEPVT